MSSIENMLNRLDLGKTKDYNLCEVEECDRPRQRHNNGSFNGRLCNMHRHQIRKYGYIISVLPRIAKKGSGRIDKNGYRTISAKGHPMCHTSKGEVYEHRKMFYDKCKGVCPHCFWCGKVLTWDTLQVDHFNGVRDDNEPENLYGTCGKCNKALGNLPYLFASILPERLSDFEAKIEAVMNNLDSIKTMNAMIRSHKP